MLSGDLLEIDRRLRFFGLRPGSGRRPFVLRRGPSFAFSVIVTGWPDQKIDDVFGKDGTPVDELDKLAKRK